MCSLVLKLLPTGLEVIAPAASHFIPALSPAFSTGLTISRRPALDLDRAQSTPTLTYHAHLCFCVARLTQILSRVFNLLSVVVICVFEHEQPFLRCVQCCFRPRWGKRFHVFTMRSEIGRFPFSKFHENSGDLMRTVPFSYLVSRPVRADAHTHIQLYPSIWTRLGNDVKHRSSQRKAGTSAHAHTCSQSSTLQDHSHRQSYASPSLNPTSQHSVRTRLWSALFARRCKAL